MSMPAHIRNGFLTLAVMFAAMPLAPSPTLAQTKIAAAGDKVNTAGAGRQILFRDNTSVKAGTDTAVTVRRANYDAETARRTSSSRSPRAPSATLPVTRRAATP